MINSIKEKLANISQRQDYKNLFLRFSLQDQILFAKRLSLLVKAGVPILEGLRMLKAQAVTKSAKTIYSELIKDVENGQSISQSMARFPKIFSEFVTNIIQVGEHSGTLQENLTYLAVELQKKQALRRKVISSLVYPILIVLATFGITGLLTVFIFPKILPIFKSVNFPLPWTTRLLIFVSNFILHDWYYILLAALILVVALVLLMRNTKIRFIVHRGILMVPILGKLLQGYYMANFCRTLGILLKSDVPIVKAISITADSVSNMAYKKELHEISVKVTEGGKMSTHMSGKARLFPPILSQMVTVGESTGHLSSSLMFLAELYESEVDELTKNLTTVLEPLLMVFMGVLVGFVAISIITPIYGITQHISAK
jgi:type IV pilus assembly protein PilC